MIIVWRKEGDALDGMGQERERGLQGYVVGANQLGVTPILIGELGR